MPANQRVIRVVGEGTETGVPDLCRMMLTLTALADTPSLAMEKIAAVARTATNRLQALGIGDRDVQTVAIQVHEWYDQSSQRITGHAALYSLSVKVTGLEGVGPLLAALGEVCGDALRVEGIQLGVTEPEPLRELARQKAVEAAKAKATQLARAADVELGQVLSIEEATWTRPGMPIVGFQAAVSPGRPAAAPIPVEPGGLDVAVSVEVVYAIGG